VTDPDGDATTTGGLRAADRQLLGLQPDPDDRTRLSMVILPHLCRLDGRFYGGAAVAAALAASEAATGRPALWSSTQLVATAELGERVDVVVDVVAAGRSVDQVHVRGLVGDRLLFNAVGATATGRSDGLHGTGPVMPRVPPPDDCEEWGMRRRAAAGDVDMAAFGGDGRVIGHHLVTDYREAPLLDTDDGRSDAIGRLLFWARLTGDAAPMPATSTPATLAFVADVVPLAVARACGVEGAGTSLDNSLRLGEPADTEWVLLELLAHVAVGGYGHGDALVWSPDGRLLATGSQSARIFSLDDFARRRAG
jgi:acyl-CoA thioesterase